MHIFVGGSLRDVPCEPDVCRQFVAELGIGNRQAGPTIFRAIQEDLKDGLPKLLPGVVNDDGRLAWPILHERG